MIQVFVSNLAHGTMALPLNTCASVHVCIHVRLFWGSGEFKDETTKQPKVARVPRILHCSASKTEGVRSHGLKPVHSSEAQACSAVHSARHVRHGSPCCQPGAGSASQCARVHCARARAKGAGSRLDLFFFDEEVVFGLACTCGRTPSRARAAVHVQVVACQTSGSAAFTARPARARGRRRGGERERATASVVALRKGSSLGLGVFACARESRTTQAHVGRDTCGADLQNPAFWAVMMAMPSRMKELAAITPKYRPL